LGFRAPFAFFEGAPAAAGPGRGCSVTWPAALWRAAEPAPSRAAARLALARCGRVRGNFASTPATSPLLTGAVSRSLWSLIAHIIAHTGFERAQRLRWARATR
jgi:hypothetical protein